MPLGQSPDPSKSQGVRLTRRTALAIGLVMFLAIVASATGNFFVDVMIGGTADAAVLAMWLLAGWGVGTAILLPLRRRFWSPLPVPRERAGHASGTHHAGSEVLRRPGSGAEVGSKPGSSEYLRHRRQGANHLEVDSTAGDAVEGNGGAATIAEGRITGLLHVTAVALGLGVIGFVTLVLGLLGVLNQATAWATLVAGVGLALYFLRNTDTSAVWSGLKSRSPGAAISWAFAVPLAIAFVAASMSPGFLWKPLDPHPYDVVSYHLQIPREWYELGRIVPLRHNSFSFFPMGMETHFLSAMHLSGGPWRGMYLCQFMSLAFAGLTAAGVVATCRSLGVGPVVSRVAGLMATCVPWTLMLAGVAYVEPGVMLYTLLAAAWAMHGLLTPRPDRAAGFRGTGFQPVSSEEQTRVENPCHADRAAILSLGLAGAMAGFACGMKYTAVAMTAAPLLVLWPIVAAWGRRTARCDSDPPTEAGTARFSGPVSIFDTEDGPAEAGRADRSVDREMVARASWRAAVLLPWLVGVVACGLVFAPWLIRNVVWSGNPVFPLAASVFGPGHFTPDQIDRYRTAHAPPVAERGVVARLRNGWNAVVIDPQFGYGLVPLATIAGGIGLLSRRGRRRGGDGDAGRGEAGNEPSEERSPSAPGKSLQNAGHATAEAVDSSDARKNPRLPPWRQGSENRSSDPSHTSVASGSSTHSVDRSSVAFIVAMLLAMLGVWLLATHVIGRFFTPAIPLMSVLAAIAFAADRGRAWRVCGGALMAGIAVVGVTWTWGPLAAALPLGRQGVFRLADLTAIESPDVQTARTSGGKVALIGDAQAFLQTVPTDRLLYRGVFDVVVPPGGNTVDSWLGRSVDQLRADGYWVVINTAELDRLTRTYAHLPRPLPPWDTVQPTPTVLPPTR